MCIQESTSELGSTLPCLRHRTLIHAHSALVCCGFVPQVGFSAVLFGMKLVLNADSPTFTPVAGVLLPTKYAAWGELLLIQLTVPNASFMYARTRTAACDRARSPLLGLVFAAACPAVAMCLAGLVFDAACPELVFAAACPAEATCAASWRAICGGPCPRCSPPRPGLRPAAPAIAPTIATVIATASKEGRERPTVANPARALIPGGTELQTLDSDHAHGALASRATSERLCVWLGTFPRCHSSASCQFLARLVAQECEHCKTVFIC